MTLHNLFSVIKSWQIPSSLYHVALHFLGVISNSVSRIVLAVELEHENQGQQYVP